MQASPNEPLVWHGTTIVTVRKGGKVVIGGDGQVSIGQTVIKSNAKKVRKLGKGDVIGGFAGAVGGIILSKTIGTILHATGGNYVPIFAIAACAYWSALLIIHLLAPKLEPARIDGSTA